MSPLSVEITKYFSTQVTNHFNETTLLITTDDNVMRELIYDVNKAPEKYVIAGVLVNDSDYILQVFLHKNYSVQTPVKETVEWVKETFELTGPELGDIVQKIHFMKKKLEESLSYSHRSTRTRDVNNKVIDVSTAPALSVMKEFYECGRKHKYVDSAEASSNLQSGTDQVYLCSYCQLFHVGQAKAVTPIPDYIMEVRWRTAWFRYSNKRS